MNEDTTNQEYTSPNDLAVEMTAEEEQAFVDEALGITQPKGEAKQEVKEDTEKAEIVTPVVEAVKEEAKEPDSTQKLTEEAQDLGTPQTDDLWIEVEKVTIDELGEQTTQKVKLVYDPEDPNSFIPDDFKAKSDRQLADILEAKAEMANLYGERKSKIDEVQTKLEESEQAASKEKEVLDGWNQEIQSLIDAGVIEAPKLKPGEAGYESDPSVVKTEEVYKYMAEQNQERIKNGNPPIRSFGAAFAMYQNGVKADEEARTAEMAEVKRKGALVGGGSSGGGAESTPYTAGSAKSIWDVPVK